MGLKIEIFIMCPLIVITISIHENCLEGSAIDNHAAWRSGVLDLGHVDAARERITHLDTNVPDVKIVLRLVNR